LTPHDLPDRFPIFPLPNVVFFPDTRLPLHMFEPRYRAMTADALDGDGLIGMVLLREAERAAEPAPAVFDVGCVGQIVEAEPLADGRYNLVLEGLGRFRILEEEPPAPYRVARVAWLDDPDYEDLDQAAQRTLSAARADLEEHLVELAKRSAPAAADALRERMRRLDPVQLIHALSLGLDVAMVEKQGLLEAADPLTRCRLLSQLLAFRRAESGLAYGSKRVN
jgi:Lon protease-like protein